MIKDTFGDWQVEEFDLTEEDFNDIFAILGKSREDILNISILHRKPLKLSSNIIEIFLSYNNITNKVNKAYITYEKEDSFLSKHLERFDLQACNGMELENAKKYIDNLDEDNIK